MVDIFLIFTSRKVAIFWKLIRLLRKYHFKEFKTITTK